MDCINLKSHQVQNLKPMLYARAYPSILTMDGSIYAIGGMRVGDFNVAERYDDLTEIFYILFFKPKMF